MKRCQSPSRYVVLILTKPKVSALDDIGVECYRVVQGKYGGGSQDVPPMRLD